MNGSTLITLLFAIIAAYTVSAFEKKSAADLSEFASAINGAGRLRYGKRSMDWNLGQLFNGDVEGFPSEDLYMYKRSPSTSKLVASLNGAERLRFGRK